MESEQVVAVGRATLVDLEGPAAEGTSLRDQHAGGGGRRRAGRTVVTAGDLSPRREVKVAVDHGAGDLMDPGAVVAGISA